MLIKWGKGFTKIADEKEAGKLAIRLAKDNYTVTIKYDGRYFIVEHKPNGE